MKTLIIVYSYHHQNTQKIAGAMAQAMGAEVKNPQEISASELAGYDLIGFGAGIDSGKHYKPLLDFAHGLSSGAGKKAFIFSTCGVYGKKKMLKDHAALREILQGKGFQIAGDFACAGLDTNSVLKYIGGIGKGRPNAEDLQAAKAFAEKLISG